MRASRIVWTVGTAVLGAVATSMLASAQGDAVVLNGLFAFGHLLPSMSRGFSEALLNDRRTTSPFPVPLLGCALRQECGQRLRELRLAPRVAVISVPDLDEAHVGHARPAA
jgi:hypothetical protein